MYSVGKCVLALGLPNAGTGVAQATVRFDTQCGEYVYAINGLFSVDIMTLAAVPVPPALDAPRIGIAAAAGARPQLRAVAIAPTRVALSSRPRAHA